MHTFDREHPSQPFNIQAGGSALSLNLPLPASTKEAGDDVLLQLIQQGSEAESERALETLFMRHNKDVWRFVRSRVSAAVDADEITSSVWVVALEKIYDFVWTGTPIKAWLLSIAHRKIREHFSHPCTLTLSLDKLAEAEEVLYFLASQLQLIEEPVAPVAANVRKEADVLLHKLIAHLSDVERKIIMLIYFEEVENATEVANRLGMNKNTIRVYHKRARDKLRGSPELSRLFEGAAG